MDKNNKIIRCIVISGIDGSGKTTVINALKEKLKSKGYNVGYIWLRFNHYFAKMMHAFARILGLSVSVDNEMGHVWQHQFYKSKLFCWFYIRATYLDSLISRLKYNKIAKNREIIICDRWITDILVDLATKTHNKNLINTKWVSRFIKIMPKRHKLFIVYRSTSEIIECRVENQLDPDFQLRLSIYDNLKQLPEFKTVNNCGSIIESVDQILNQIYE